MGTVFVDEGETVQLGRELLTLTEPEFTISLSANPTDRSELQLGPAVCEDPLFSEIDDLSPAVCRDLLDTPEMTDPRGGRISW